jgi:hypothetical protein
MAMQQEARRMEFRTTFVQRPAALTLAATCDAHPPAIARETDRLAAIAASRGIGDGAPPFVQLCGPFVTFVNVPVTAATGDPMPQESRIPAGWVARTQGVSFAEARAVTREVGMAIAGSWAVDGPAEFHPEAPGAQQGALVIPVRPVGAFAPASPLSASRPLVTAIPGR